MARNKLKIDNAKLRSFSLIVAAGFAVIGVAPMIFRGHNPRIWAFVVAVVLAATGLIYAPVLKPVYKVWMAIGEVLAWVNTRIILGILFYGLIVPIGIMLRMTNKDPMRRS